MNVLSTLKKNLRNIPGMRMNRKIVVIESDDWGSERVQNKKSLIALQKKGYEMESSRMNMVDCLESNTDLEMLFEMLSSFSDRNDRPPVLSAFFNVANPDYEKIRASDYSTYQYLTIQQTAEKYSDHDRIAALYQTGFQAKVFHSDYHGREHLQVNRWLKKLRAGHPDICFAFDLEFNALPLLAARGIDVFRVAYEVDDAEDLQFMTRSVVDGLDLFEQTFGYRTNYFVAPNGVYPRNGVFEQALKGGGVDYLGGASMQKVFTKNKGYRKAHHFLGKRNFLNQTYITRNGLFEPYAHGDVAVANTLNDIELAFRWNKPAIISSHRANYVGSLSEANRDGGLRNLKRLLHEILKRWPDVEFMSTKELTALISEKQK